MKGKVHAPWHPSRYPKGNRKNFLAKLLAECRVSPRLNYNYMTPKRTRPFIINTPKIIEHHRLAQRKYSNRNRARTHDSRSVWHVNYRVLTRPAAGHILRTRRRYGARDIHRRRRARITSHIVIFYTRYVTCTYHQHGIILCLCRYIPMPAAPFRGYNYYHRRVPIYIIYTLVSPSVYPRIVINVGWNFQCLVLTKFRPPQWPIIIASRCNGIIGGNMIYY